MKIITYNNFFEWYDKEQRAWSNDHPNSLYGPGISNELFIYFILLYLYKDKKFSTNNVYQLKSILRKHSKKYRKEKFFLKVFNRLYRDKEWNKDYKIQTITEFNIDMYKSLPDDIFIRFCKEYLSKPHYYVDSIGCSQANLDYLYSILEKHSLRFKFEKILYKFFK